MNLNTLKNLSTFQYVLIASLLLFIARLAFVHFGPIDLAPDEAHYWEWSRYLDWSYYSKPPMVAWLNALSTSVFGHTVIGVRFFAVLTLSLLTLLSYQIAVTVTGKESAGVWAAVLLNVTPEFAAGGLMMTPDIPALFFWASALYVLMKIDFHAPPQKKDLNSFILIGVLVGFAGLSKQTTALFYPLLGLYLSVDKDRRKYLLHPYVYTAGLISLAFQAPVFYWNSMNDWITFKHVLGQSSGSSHFNGVKSIGNFLGGQIALVGLLSFPLLVWAWLRLPKYTYSDKKLHQNMRLLWWFSAPLFLAFLFKSIGAKVQPNWPVLSIYSGLILLSCWIVFESFLRQKILMIGCFLSILLTLLTLSMTLPLHATPLKPVLGWKGLGIALSEMTHRISSSRDIVILTSRYQTASELSFYMEDHPYVIYTNPGHRRQNQYDLWEWPSLHDKIVFYVREKSKEVPKNIRSAFASCVYIGDVASTHKKALLRYAHIHACGGYISLKRAKPEKY